MSDKSNSRNFIVRVLVVSAVALIIWYAISEYNESAANNHPEYGVHAIAKNDRNALLENGFVFLYEFKKIANNKYATSIKDKLDNLSLSAIKENILTFKSRNPKCKTNGLIFAANAGFKGEIQEAMANDKIVELYNSVSARARNGGKFIINNFKDELHAYIKNDTYIMNMVTYIDKSTNGPGLYIGCLEYWPVYKNVYLPNTNFVPKI